MKVWVGFWVYECAQPFYPYEGFIESVCRRRTSFRVQLPEPSRPDAADADTYRHSTTDILWHIVFLFFHLHTIMSTHCTCAQNEVPSWTVGVIVDGLSPPTPPPAHTHPFLLSAESPQLLSPPGITHNSTQCSSLYTTIQPHNTTPVSKYPSAYSRWRQQSNHSEHDLSMRHELHQVFSRVLSLYGKFDSSLLGIHCTQERPVDAVTKESFKVMSLYWPLISLGVVQDRRIAGDVLWCLIQKINFSTGCFTKQCYCLSSISRQFILCCMHLWL